MLHRLVELLLGDLIALRSLIESNAPLTAKWDNPPGTVLQHFSQV